jgi:hypothetical protein
MKTTTFAAASKSTRSSSGRGPLVRRLVLGLALLGLAGCGGGGGGGGGSVLFVVRNAKKAAAASSPVTVSGKWLIYLADEATTQTAGAPTNLNVANGDADAIDSIAVVVDMSTLAETCLNVAAVGAVIAGDQIYLIVDESQDSFDWDTDGSTNDLVLLHFGGTSGTPSPASVNTEFVDTLESSADVPALAVSGRVYYTRDDSAVIANGDTSLSYLEQTAPTTPVTVLHIDAGTKLHPRIIRADENLLFLYADEVVEGRDLNTDADSADGFVLALLDSTDLTAKVHGVELALEDDSAEVRAQNVAAGDWIVAFLVNEAAQDDFLTGLNNPALFSPSWKPLNCPLYADTDTLDNVLHYLSFAAWDADPITTPPVNTGLAGEDKVVIVGTTLATAFVATIAKETDDGACDLNADGDTSDEVLRWVKTTTPVLPYGTSAQLVAIDDNVPGGAFGATDIDNRLLSVVDETQDGRDHDGDGNQTHRLLAWLNPSAVTPAWVYDHNSDTTGGIDHTAFFSPSWLGERAERDKLVLAFREAIYGIDSFGTDLNGDGDTSDSIAAFSDFDPADPNDLDFAWHGAAVEAANAGVVIANNVLFYRVDEISDGKEWGGPGLDDKVLFRSPIANATLAATMNVLNGLPVPSVFNSGNNGAAYLCDEASIAQDLNGDGDTSDFVVRWFRIG